LKGCAASWGGFASIERLREREVEKVVETWIEGLKGLKSWKKRKRSESGAWKRNKRKCQECTWKCALCWGAKCTGKDEWLSKYNVTMTEGHTAPTALFCNRAWFYSNFLTFTQNWYLILIYFVLQILKIINIVFLIQLY